MSTRPPVPGSNCQCSQLGSGNNACFQHPDTGLNSGTSEPRQHLQSKTNEEFQNVQTAHQTIANLLSNASPYNRNERTLLFSCHLTGNTWDVTVEASPSSLTLAGVGGTLLPTRTSIFAGSRVTPAHKILI